jgi:hypothetical protein
MGRSKGNFNFAANLEVLAKAPLDAKQKVDLYSDLTDPATWEDNDGNAWLTNGLIVAVGNDPVTSNNGIYYLADADNYTLPGSWVKSGAGSITGATNLGIGNGSIFADVSGSTINLKTLSGGSNILITSNNNYISISSIAGTSGNFENVTKRIIQNSHGFALMDVIGWSGGTYNKAIADGTYDGEVIGLVTNYIDTDTFDLTQSGYVTGLTGLTTNSTYFLSDDTEGLLTVDEPTLFGHVSKTILVATSTTSGWILPYVGYIILSGTTEHDNAENIYMISASTTYTATTNSCYIGVVGGGIIYLPINPLFGQKIIVNNYNGDALANNIIIYGNGNNIIDSNDAIIDTNYGSITMIYNGINWSIIG